MWRIFIRAWIEKRHGGRELLPRSESAGEAINMNHGDVFLSRGVQYPARYNKVQRGLLRYELLLAHCRHVGRNWGRGGLCEQTCEHESRPREVTIQTICLELYDQLREQAREASGRNE